MALSSDVGLIPILLILLGVVASVAVAWGNDPALAERTGDLELLCLMHRLQWVFIGTAVICGMLLTALVVFSRRRAWWLLGLAPVVGLFGWRFAVVGAERSLWIEDQPTYASAQQSGWLDDGASVIGVVINDQPYAYPIAAMTRAPVVVMNDRDRRFLLAWSREAGAASAVWLDRSVRGRDLEIVSAPAGVLLIYNRRLGEFFDGLTFRRVPDRQSPQGVGSPIGVRRESWGQWRAAYPETLVLQPRWTPVVDAPGQNDPGMFLLLCDPPLAVSGEVDEHPRNIAGAGASSAMVFLDGRGKVRAFQRRVDEDLFPQFMLRSEARTGRKSLVDGDTGTTWTVDGVAIDGPLKGTRLRPIVLVEGVSPAAVRFWAPDATIVD